MTTPITTRILVVDDERLIADTLSLILTRAGFEVLATYSGINAVGAAHDFRPDIVLADYSMPGIDGIETCVQINRLFPACRGIILSALILDRFADYGASDQGFVWLCKPMHPTDLLNAILAEEITSNSSQAHLRVLNVDDVEEHRYSLSRLFSHAGFEVVEAASGSEALQVAFESKPDLILLDIHLPDRDGYDVCASLKKNPETSAIPVVHLTAMGADSISALRSKEAGADDYIPYPVVPKRLVQRTRELLQLRYLNGATG